MSQSTPFTITIETVARHRTGAGGTPFHVVLFRDPTGRKLATVFAAPGHVAVLDLDHAHRGEVRFGFNAFRGDVYELILRDAIARAERAGTD